MTRHHLRLAAGLLHHGWRTRTNGRRRRKKCLQSQQHAAASWPPNVLSNTDPTWPRYPYPQHINVGPSKMKHSSSLCLLVLLAALCSLVQAQVLFQGFNWESWKAQGGWYNCLKARVNDIADAGVTHVWLPPPSHSVSPQGTLS
ncbi:hypothetical protein PR202_gb02918 [Eleusine coracana subsp. coracana]|uniref:Alpha-amylase n=1 Tax=Eleusine coracana subsp. coracana TaxID=191504 RepID=A0AAV5DYZ2_ELECO|nr:hypothetical protein PR202_gb02918 [Eleusine coracana subsp. coracana]